MKNIVIIEKFVENINHFFPKNMQKTKDVCIFTKTEIFKDIVKKSNEILKNDNQKVSGHSICKFFTEEIKAAKSFEKVSNDTYKLFVDKDEFLTILLEEFLESKNKIILKCLMDEFKFDEQVIHLKNMITPPDDIHYYRSKLKDMMRHDSPNSQIYLLNDGTGSGKTYNVIDSLIDQTSSFSHAVSNRKELHSLIYITPQKIQMKFGSNIYKNAYHKNIPFLQIKASTDLVDLDMICWSLFDEKKGLHLNNKEFFSRIFESPKAMIISTLKDNIRKDLINMEKVYRAKYKKNNDLEEAEEEVGEKEIKMPNIEKVFNSYHSYIINDKDWSCPEEDLDKSREDFSYQLNKLADFLITHIDKVDYERIISNMSATSIDDVAVSSKNDFYYHIIAHCRPLEIAKYRPVIINITADKYAYSIAYSDYSKKKNEKEKMVVRRQSIDEIISGINHYTDGEVSRNIDFPEDEQRKFLKEDFFKKTPNIFDEKNVSFSLVIDEEHVFSKNEIQRYNVVDILGDGRRSAENQYNIIDSLSIISRVMSNAVGDDHRGSNDESKRDKNQFIKTIADNLYEHSEYFRNKSHLRMIDLKKDLDKDPVYKFFKKFSDNIMHFNISAHCADHLSLICSNIYAYSPKTLLQIDTLKNIELTISSSGIFVMKKGDVIKEANHDYISLYDLFQVILVVLYSCRDMTKTLYNSLVTVSYSDSQNKALQRLSNVCAQYKKYLESMFDSTHNINPQSNVNILLVYFLAKIMFSINLREHIEKGVARGIHIGKGETEFIFGEIKITLSKELFEVSILRILQKKKNKVLLLSATRGYENIYSGQYSIDFFQKYKNLNNPYEIIVRENDDMLNLTKKRKEKRKVCVNHFSGLDIEKNNIYDSYVINSVDTIDKKNVSKKINSLSPEELKVFETIYGKIKNKQMYYRSGKYKKLEIDQLLFFIALHSAKRENAMIMTLSNDYISILKKSEFFSNKKGLYDFYSEDLKFEIKKDEQVYEFILPNDNTNTVKKTRIVLFNSKLGTESEIEKAFQINKNEDTNVIFISSYNSAGTGVNFCINDEKDFDAISFANDPYYTAVKNENGFSNSTNTLLKLKNMAFKSNITTLEAVDTELSSNEGYEILMREHLLEILKTIEQAVGRIERRDYDDFQTTINFIDNEYYSLFKNTMSQYYHCNYMHKNLPVMKNKSVLNRSLYNLAEFVIQDYKFNNLDDKSEFEDLSSNNHKIVKDFFENTYKNWAKEFRSGNNKYDFFPKFNGLLRNIISLDNWTSQKINILNTFKQKIDDESFSEMKSFFNACVLDLEKILNDEDKGKTIYYNKTRSGYTDITGSNSPYNLKEEISFSLMENIPHIQSVQDEINNKNDTNFIPVPYFNSIIKGNIGEYVFKSILDKAEIKYEKEDFFIKPYNSIYELFDFIFMHDDKIICIDVKNWSRIDNGKGNKLISSISSKTEKIKTIFNKPVLFYYINVDPKNNGNGLQGINLNIKNHDSYFMNLFGVNSYYTEKEKKNRKGKVEKVIELNKEGLSINPDFYKIF